MEEDCAVCLQTRNHPTQLPCGHIFCFLCMKGIALQTRKCALCRAEIPADYLEHPVILEKLDEINRTNDEVDSEETQYQWYYEGRNGWWKYDERSNMELESAWNSSATDCRLLLAGAAYIIDFETMLQTRRSDPRRRRQVRRDNTRLPAKGIAGIKIPTNENKIDDVENENINEIVNQSEVRLPEFETPILETTVSQDSENSELVAAIQNGVDLVTEQMSGMNMHIMPEEHSEENQ